MSAHTEQYGAIVLPRREHPILNWRCFNVHDLANPGVWLAFDHFALERYARGFRRYSARDIYARVRWETHLPSPGQGEDFKVTNHWSPFYARKFLHKHPDLAAIGYFELHASEADFGMPFELNLPNRWRSDPLEHTPIVRRDYPSPQPEDTSAITCDCITCRTLAPQLVAPIRYACEICGNKRCPHHTDHRLDCTGSNKPGQPGSVYQ